MGSHGAVGKGGGGKEKGKPGIADAEAAADVSVVDEVAWLVPDENNTHAHILTWYDASLTWSRKRLIQCS